MKTKESTEIHGYIKGWKRNKKTGLIIPLTNNKFIHNITPNEFITSIFDEHFLGNSTPSFHISHSALSTSFDIPQRTTTLEGELERIAVTPTGSDGNYTNDITYIDTQAVTASTTITAVVSASEITVDDITGFNTGDRIALTLTDLNGQIAMRKATISGSNIIFDKPFDSSSNLTIGDAVNQMISRIHLVCNGGSSANGGGVGLSIAPVFFTKTIDEVVNFIHKIIIK